MPFSLYKPNFLIVLFCFLFLQGKFLAANPYNNKQILDKNNSIDQPVFNIALDIDGFIWISSRSMISRYDGRNLKYYSLTNTDIVSDNQGRQIFLRKDKENRLWAFTDSGKIYEYDAKSDSFSLFYTAVVTDGYLLLNDIFWDSKGKLWMATTVGLAYYNPDNNPVNKMTMFIKGHFSNVITSISNSILAIGTNNGLVFFDTDNKKILDETLYHNEHITTIYYNRTDNSLWIGTFSSGLFVWDIQKKKDITPDYVHTIPHVPIKVIKYFDDKNLLIGLDGRGVYKVNIYDKISKQFLSDTYRGKEAIEGNGVYDILVDKKNIWVGTYTGGVTIIKEPGMFDWIRHTPYNKESLMNNYVHSVCEDRDGDLWYATKSGVSRYNTRARNWKHYFEGENTFLTITEDDSGNIWCGGFSTGIYSINKKTGNIRHIRSLKNMPQADCIYASALDSDNNIWFGGLYNPLTCISKDGKGKERFSYFEIYQVNSISSINQDTLFVSTTSGFYLLNRKTKEFRQYFANPAQYGVQSNSFVYTGVQVNDNIWFGTDGGGLNCFNIPSGKIENFSTYNGFPSNYIYGMVDDKKGKLWVSTNRGMFTFDPVKKVFISNIDELPVKQFVFNSFSTLSGNRMAFGSRNGVVIFNPDKVIRDSLSSSLQLTDFRLFYNKVTSKDKPEILSASINDVSFIKLDYDQNTFSFDFITIDFYDPDNYIYEYKLEGFDKDWVSKGDVLTADYMNVPPGKYTFIVRSKSNSKGDILAERSISIVINQPFWNTIWAWILYLLVAVGVVYWMWNYYREKLLKKQSEEKIDFFINIAHDIRTPLSLVIAPLSDLEKEGGLSAKSQGYLRMAMQNSDKLLSIVTQLLDFQKVGKLSTTLELDVCDFGIYLKDRVDRLDILAHNKSIHLQTVIPDEDMHVEIDVKKMDRILDNLLSNAIKYTGINGEVHVRLQKKDKKLILEIEDNGIGISKSEQSKIFRHFYRANNAINSKEVGSGIGLVFTKKLVELMLGELSFISHENVGTTFTLSLRLKESISQEKNIISRALPKVSTSDMKLHAATRKHRLDSYKILLVEDNDDMRNYLTHTLSADNNIQSVSSAEDALSFLRNHTVDLVISDIMMPGMNGNELCRLLKNNIETSHIQVILLTALADKEQMLVGLEYGADDYITKPFNVEVLKIKIHNFMNTRKRMQQYYLTLTNLKEVSNQDVTTIEDVKGNSIDDDFLKNCINIVTANISNTNFTINDMCRELAMSRTLVYEKLKILTNQSPNEFIRSIRLKQAKELLFTRKYTVQEVSEMTGFSDSKYFSTVFKKYYGESPSKI